MDVCITVLVPVHTAMAAEVGQSLVIIPHKGEWLVAVSQCCLHPLFLFPILTTCVFAHLSYFSACSAEKE